MPTPDITPTPAQQAVIDDVVSTSRRITRIHGYAGSGKTAVVAARVIAGLEARGVSVQVLAPTGKAAKVLRSKGLHGASTIHSYLYTPSKRERRAWREQWDDFSTAARERHPNLAPALAEIDTAIPEADVEPAWDALTTSIGGKLAKRATALRTEKRFELAFTAAGAIAFFEDAGIPAADVVLVDEASMVSARVADDLGRTGSRLIFVGDPAQLPPVKAQRSEAAMGAPHHLLTEVHRQKGGSPVLKLATKVRTAELPALKQTGRGDLLRLEDYDQVLCWRNATREHVNAEMRRRLGRARGVVPEPGDRLVCLKNTKMPEDGGKQWMNGEQATVLDADAYGFDRLLLAVRDDEGAEWEVESPAATFGGHRAETEWLDRNGWASTDPAFAFGYALTVHKAQGSEWPRVLLVDESADMIALTSRREGRAAALDQARQWLYTGTTRAAETLHVVRSLREVA